MALSRVRSRATVDQVLASFQPSLESKDYLQALTILDSAPPEVRDEPDVVHARESTGVLNGAAVSAHLGALDKFSALARGGYEQYRLDCLQEVHASKSCEPRHRSPARTSTRWLGFLPSRSAAPRPAPRLGSKT